MNSSPWKSSLAAPRDGCNYAIAISCEEAYLLFSKWRDSDSKLHVAFFGCDNRIASSGWILEAFAKDETVLVLVAAEAPSKIWSVPLQGASFRYGEPVARTRFSGYGEGKWAAYLSVEMPNGFSALFAERETFV